MYISKDRRDAFNAKIEAINKLSKPYKVVVNSTIINDQDYFSLSISGKGKSLIINNGKLFGNHTRQEMEELTDQMIANPQQTKDYFQSL